MKVEVILRRWAKPMLTIILLILAQSIAPSTIGMAVLNTQIEEVVVIAPKLRKEVLKKQIWVESRNIHTKDKKLLKSPAGAVGIAQFLPSTWNYLKRIGVLPKYYDIHNREDQLLAHRKFMNYLWNKDYGISYNKERLALASYNAGSGKVRSLIKKYDSDWESHLPKETQKYIEICLDI